jgi:hypothetical protein
MIITSIKNVKSALSGPTLVKPNTPLVREDKKKLLRFLVFGVIIVAIILFTIACFIISSRKGNPPTDNVITEIITYSTDNPSEEPPIDNYIWIGNVNDPKYIKLPSVGIQGYIQNVGVDQNAQIAVPNNVHFAGWFVDSVRPGSLGLSIIDGHLNGTSRGGIFRNLESLKKDSEFEIEMGNGNILQFKVIDVVTVSLEKAVDVLFSQYPNVLSQLNLITCGGTYNKEAHKYEQRVIAIAEYIGSN